VRCSTEHGRAGCGHDVSGLPLRSRRIAGAGSMSRRRYVARGVPGGYRIWDNKARRWWGDHYEVQPDELVAELNCKADYERVIALLKRYRALKR
jgi:hypothetical protein